MQLEESLEADPDHQIRLMRIRYKDQSPGFQRQKIFNLAGCVMFYLGIVNLYRF